MTNPNKDGWIEHLRACGYAKGMYEITEKGKAFLAARKGGAE